MNNKPSSINLVSDTYYKSIQSLTFIPTTKYKEYEVAVRKGEIYSWRLLGLIPFIPLKAKSDLVLCRGNGHFFNLRYCTVKRAFRIGYAGYNRCFYLQDNTVLRKIIHH